MRIFSFCLALLCSVLTSDLANASLERYADLEARDQGQAIDLIRAFEGEYRQGERTLSLDSGNGVAVGLEVDGEAASFRPRIYEGVLEHLTYDGSGVRFDQAIVLMVGLIVRGSEVLAMELVFWKDEEDRARVNIVERTGLAAQPEKYVVPGSEHEATRFNFRTLGSWSEIKGLTRQ